MHSQPCWAPSLILPSPSLPTTSNRSSKPAPQVSSGHYLDCYSNKDGHWYKADDFHLYFVRPLTADEDVYTAIGEVKKEEVNMKNEVIYDLQGRRIAADSRHSSLLSPGIYISGGKKVLVK